LVIFPGYRIQQRNVKILHFREARVSVLPKEEELLVNICSPGKLCATHRLRNIMSGLNLVETKHS
jgi:hypothetical protein